MTGPPIKTPLHIDKEKQTLHPAWLQWFNTVSATIKQLQAQVEALTP